jgi:hypothetical protein
VIDDPCIEDLHSSGDGCAIYDPGYRVIRQDDGEVSVEDLEVGDLYRDETFECEGEWFEVEDIVIVDDDVHIQSGELITEDDEDEA